MLDLQLPKLDGFAIVQHLRDNAKVDSLPIVMMTAYDPEEFRGTTIAAAVMTFCQSRLTSIFWTQFSISLFLFDCLVGQTRALTFIEKGFWIRLLPGRKLE